MSNLGRWLEQELNRRQLTQGQLAVYSGVGQATISDMINKGHVPRVETLFRLADYLGTSRNNILRLAGYLEEPPPGFNGMRPDFKETFYRLNEIWEAVARKDKTGEGIRELLTMQVTNADAFLAFMSAMERQQDEERRESKADSGA